MSKIATREAYGKTLASLICENENIIVLDADLSKSTKTNDAKVACPERHLNMGIAEGNMMSVAAGLATCDNVVFASTFAMFAAGRAYEQIRNSIGYPHLNVKVCATHAGITVGEDGASHQTFEDVSLMRGIPGMTVITPCDAEETKQVIEYAAKTYGPFYIRLGRSGVDSVYDENYKFEIGKGNIIKKGQKIALICNGRLVQEAIKADEILKQANIDVTICNMPCVKPIDQDMIIDLAKSHDLIITCEEHGIIGGLGSAVCEVLAESYPKRVIRIGQRDTYGESGTPDQLLAKYKMDYNAIIEVVKENI